MTEQHRYPWLLVRTSFHGGGIISQHRTEKAAKRAAGRDGRERDRLFGHCECGCAGVIRRDQYDRLPQATNGGISAGALARS
jgi:hypothetical protein